MQSGDIASLTLEETDVVVPSVEHELRDMPARKVVLVGLWVAPSTITVSVARALGRKMPATPVTSRRAQSSRAARARSRELGGVVGASAVPDVAVPGSALKPGAA